MKTVLAALIWGVVNSTMVYKTLGSSFSNHQHHSDIV